MPDAARSARILLAALDIFEAACNGVSAETAIAPTRAAVDGVTVEELQAVAVALAVEAVWSLPPALVRPRTDVQIRERQRQVRAWVERTRLEALWLVE